MKTGNCPYCGSSNCKLGMSDFFSKKKKVKSIKNPLAELSEREDFKDHMKRIEHNRTLGK